MFIQDLQSLQSIEQPNVDRIIETINEWMWLNHITETIIRWAISQHLTSKAPKQEVKVDKVEKLWILAMATDVKIIKKINEIIDYINWD